MVSYNPTDNKAVLQMWRSSPWGKERKKEVMRCVVMIMLFVVHVDVGLFPLYTPFLSIHFGVPFLCPAHQGFGTSAMILYVDAWMLSGRVRGYIAPTT